MKSVLISIQPYYVFLIIAKAMGWNIPKYKTVEVRKNYPHAADWDRKVIVYCSKNKKSFNLIPKEYQPLMKRFLGTIIGEFMCNDIWPMSVFRDERYLNEYEPKEFPPGSCITDKQVIEYLGNGVTGYAWYIKDLKIYHNPKNLNAFQKYVKKCFFENEGKTCRRCNGCEPIRPPQSWLYVKEV